MIDINKSPSHDPNSNNDHEYDPTAPFYDTEAFQSLWTALRWKNIRTRAPICFRKTRRSRYMLANIVYLGYTIGFLIADFGFPMNASTDDTSTNSTSSIADVTTTPIPILDQPAGDPPIVNKMYFSFAIVHLISAFLYWWAWDDRSWRDVIMIPEYLNHIEAGLYIWSTSWYSRLDTLGGHYTMIIHKIETTAGIIDVFATFGWIMSWYMTYTRTLGRGFTLDDPDVIAFSTTTIGSILYIIYNLQVLIHPEQYSSNTLYIYGDILYFIGAVYYIFANMRDYNWFWYLPLAGQYGVAAGTISVETRTLPRVGKPEVLMTDCCIKRPKKSIERHLQEAPDVDNDIVVSFH